MNEFTSTGSTLYVASLWYLWYGKGMSRGWAKVPTLKQWVWVTSISRELKRLFVSPGADKNRHACGTHLNKWISVRFPVCVWDYTICGCLQCSYGCSKRLQAWPQRLLTCLQFLLLHLTAEWQWSLSWIFLYNCLFLCKTEIAVPYSLGLVNIKWLVKLKCLCQQPLDNKNSINTIVSAVAIFIFAVT